MGDREGRCGLARTGVVYLMRGLPSSGKSHTARRLADDTGVVCETDAFFRSEEVAVTGESGFRPELMEQARQWNFERFSRILVSGASPVIVDRGNGLSLETAKYAALALESGYQVELREPDSPWWQEIRVLLKYREYTDPVLRIWADRLAELSLSSHRIPAETIWSQMRTWRYDLQVQDILSLNDKAEVGPKPADAIGSDDGAGAMSIEAPRSSPRRPAAGLSRPEGKDWLREFLLEEPP